MAVQDTFDSIEFAKSVLAQTWTPKKFPVDPVWIASQMGLRVLDAELSERISGALVKKVGEDPVILLNKADSKNRKRFSCAHELGHCAYRMSNGADHYEFIDYRDNQSSAGTNPEEIFASRFAAELLMPENEVKRLRREGMAPLLIARFFGVSDDAIRIRFQSLGLSP
ncbi:MAG: ImmA/IrrE family metallo-endopeptidase [Methylococcales bacterium]